VPITPELSLLFAIRGARAQFFDELVAHGEAYWREHPPAFEKKERPVQFADTISDLRSEEVGLIAEFFFTIHEAGEAPSAQIEAYLNEHNRQLEEKKAWLKRERRAETYEGLSPQRLDSGIFNPDQIHAVVDQAETGILLFDQSTLGRLFIEAMSPERCRQLLVLLSRCGLLRRYSGSAIRVGSYGEGVLEQMYGQQMRRVLETTRLLQGEAA